MKNCIIVIFLFFSVQIIAQNNGFNDIELANDTLNSHFEKMAKAKTDNEKLTANEKIITLLDAHLSRKSSFDYQFSAKYLGNIMSPDSTVRIITWNIPYSDGTFEYFGYIQYKKTKDSDMLLIPLKDSSKVIDEPEKATCTNEKWFGALYYEIIPVETESTKYYTLLGWDGNDLFSTKKIIDVLYFDENGQALFGFDIFRNFEARQTAKRVIFEYSSRVDMLLKYFDKDKMIVFEHLSPIKPQYKGNFQFYSPDMSTDALVLEDGKWLYKPNINFKNPEKDKHQSDKPDNGLERN